MRVVISPYHLSTRETPAMAAILLADECVTLLPMGRGGSSTAREIAERSESYRELVRSWGWADELWRAGVLKGDIEGTTAVEDVRHAAESILEDPSFERLRPLMHDHLFEDDASYLNALAYDIMKSGPDPGISVPVAAGLDTFASRHGAFAARAHWKSVAQTAEAYLMSGRVSCVLPAMIQADASRLISARSHLSGPLSTLRRAISDCAAATTSVSVDALKSAAAEYSDAFARSLPIISQGAKDDDVRMITGDIAMTVCALPRDAVLRSSVRAMQAMSRVDRGRTDAAALTVSPGAPVHAIYFKTLGGGR